MPGSIISNTDDGANAERFAMVQEQLRARGIADERVLQAMAEVPRHRFVPERLRHAAYADRALPLGQGQTISQPYMVARTCELAAPLPGDRVLEVGAGSGYQAAVLGRIAAEVIAVELLPELAQRAAALIAELGIDNVRIVQGDGMLGYPDRAPFDAIVVAAGTPDVPPALIEQLALNGRAVMPLGGSSMQLLTRLRRTESGIEREQFEACVFVPLRGAGGWTERN